MSWDPPITPTKTIIAPTMYDMLSAVVYTHQRMLYDKCNENKLNLKGIAWDQDDANRSYRCPENMPDHPTPYGPIKCFNGHCRFNKDGCDDISCYPYKGPDGTECRPGDKDCSPNCYDRFKLYQDRVDADGKTISPARPDTTYTEWKLDPYDNKEKCVIGNMFFRRWCEYPKSRDTKCVIGKTNAVPFVYNRETSKCSIPHDYCTNSGSAKCDSYVSGMDINYSANDDPSKSKCSVPAGEEFTENFITGKTIFRTLKELFTDIPLSVTQMSDQNSKKHLLVKNFVNGLSLYLLQNKNKVVVGFDPKEVKGKYPKLVSIIKQIEGNQDIITVKWDKSLSKEEKKIFMTIKNKDRFTNLIRSISKGKK